MIHRLMDSIDPDELAAAEKAASAIDGVQSATVRGRWMGRSLPVPSASSVHSDAHAWVPSVHHHSAVPGTGAGWAAW